MSTCTTHSAPEPVFAEPWHAQVFALTVALNEAGQFEWSDWADRFSHTLKLHGLDKELDGGNDYFHAWLENLEQLLVEQGSTLPGDIQRMRNAWEVAYLTTPHGQPVHLAAGE
ncbi:nitrile hydratase accessory protein [Ruegeria arenilitoris]|uniref:nitrile hydratase accessory protein n=1 Tax=Ruegeria arenilitoris TaxID=1173585 RepID=UPI0014798A34|nr:nitrile hydratase accessory protein [Ruegeria arenilitoris]